MNFENLANELLLDLFEYFSSIELLQIFLELNSRLNELLYEHLQRCPLDCRSISKENFLSLCRNQLPAISQQICSIYLSNEDETFDQLNLFFSFNLHFHQFTQLKALTLESINSTSLLHQILSQCPQVIYLNLRKCFFDNQLSQAKLCLNTIWGLSQLQSCYLNDFFVHLLTTNSASIEYLSIENHPLSFDCLISLFSFTPNLTNLNIQIRDNHNEQLFSFPIRSLTNLKLNFRGEWKTLQNFLENLPNLSKLNLQIYDSLIYGHQWEDLIKNSLAKLRHFQYLNHYQFDQTKEIQQEFEELCRSYDTPFWLDEHQWFIRCDCQSDLRRIYLYTLPYSFRRFQHYDYDLSKSTNDNRQIFPYVREIIFEQSLSKLPFQFPRIQHLELAIPFHDHFWATIPDLDQLKTLEIISIAHSNEFEQSIRNLRLVLERSHRLYSLTIDYLVLSQLTSEGFLQRPIRRLDLMVNDGHFYGQECLNLIEHLVDNQCEVLLINLENRETIGHLIQKFTRLRTLICQCQEDQWGESLEANENDTAEDELIHWLGEHLPSTYSINRDENEISVIRIWIR